MVICNRKVVSAMINILNHSNGPGSDVRRPRSKSMYLKNTESFVNMSPHISNWKEKVGKSESQKIILSKGVVVNLYIYL